MARVKISVVFNSGARIGPGKVKLLESVHSTGSISAAARAMGMSYKRAWLLLDSINQAFAQPVVTGAPGGRHGGGATLTPFGSRLLARIKRIEAAAVAAARKDVAALEKTARPEAGPKI
jgi:molybdate transport system regulatory protein